MPESLQTDYAKGLMVALAHVNSNVRLAAAEAIAAGMYEFPATVAVGSSSLLSFLPLLADIFISFYTARCVDLLSFCMISG